MSNAQRDLQDQAKDKYNEAKDQAKDKYNEAKDEAKDTYNKVKNEAKDKLQEASSKVEDGVSQLPGSIRKAGDNLKSASHVVADKTEDFLSGCSNMKDSAEAEIKDDLTKLSDYIKQHPVKSLLTAGVVAFGLASLLKK